MPKITKLSTKQYKRFFTKRRTALQQRKIYKLLFHTYSRKNGSFENDLQLSYIHDGKTLDSVPSTLRDRTDVVFYKWFPKTTAAKKTESMTNIRGRIDILCVNDLGLYPDNSFINFQNY